MVNNDLPVSSVGRIVHYMPHGKPSGEYQPRHRAAIITEVPDDAQPECAVGLSVLTPQGIFFNADIPFDATGTKGGTWHWPEFVPNKPKASE